MADKDPTAHEQGLVLFSQNLRLPGCGILKLTLLITRKAKVKVAQSCLWNSPGENTGVGPTFIFPLIIKTSIVQNPASVGVLCLISYLLQWP